MEELYVPSPLSSALFGVCPAAAWQSTEESDTHVEDSQAVSPIRTPGVWSVCPK